MTEKAVCSSLKTRITNEGGSTSFLCPQCGESEVIRSKKARELAVKYKCHSCGFEGPN